MKQKSRVMKMETKENIVQAKTSTTIKISIKITKTMAIKEYNIKW